MPSPQAQVAIKNRQAANAQIPPIAATHGEREPGNFLPRLQYHPNLVSARTMSFPERQC